MNIFSAEEIQAAREESTEKTLKKQQLENQIELQPECTSFQIYDSNWGEQIPYMPANHGGLCYVIPEDEDETNPNYSDRQYTKLTEDGPTTRTAYEVSALTAQVLTEEDSEENIE